MDLQNKVVWITGASSGIGEATAYEFGKHNCKLILSARRETELLRVKENLALPDGDVMVLPMDVEEIEKFDTLTEKVIAHFGHIDILFNNAGISQRSFVLETNIEVYRKLIDIDLISVIALTKSVLPYMVKRESGHIAATSSVAGIVATPGRSGYAAAKFALRGFYDSLRAEVYKYNIGVTVVCPGYINTDISKNSLSADGSKYGKMDNNQINGLSSTECAKQIVKSISANKNEVYIGGLKELAGVYLKRFFPKILSKIVVKQAPK
ncbi:SDR family oxidoreductase [Arcticibacterium luteifluviistationis]|uniref:Short chain dehydrogenase n=1 Tax=Arcticibacterium luteifluviistationis TaxID=1784714 RepID=A0A2Z4GDW3_9BACT|nr:SDR family oxidoreductase [Arcticibacterium luteifluviistationis]AWV99436.1 short chain dehydrogenase [Arcticibacterium luteifluviistationis]